ncbi:hypothetical protein PAXINDRAFT_179526, partial [Paxillus involutus ATCC 200175]
HTFAPTTLGWIFGIVITLSLTWLGWYENIRSYANLRYWLFERDYKSDICWLLWKGFIAGDYFCLHFGIHSWNIRAVLYDIPLGGGVDREGNHIWGTSVYRLVVVDGLSTCLPVYQ